MIEVLVLRFCFSWDSLSCPQLPPSSNLRQSQASLLVEFSWLPVLMGQTFAGMSSLAPLSLVLGSSLLSTSNSLGIGTQPWGLFLSSATNLKLRVVFVLFSVCYSRRKFYLCTNQNLKIFGSCPSPLVSLFWFS